MRKDQLSFLDTPCCFLAVATTHCKPSSTACWIDRTFRFFCNRRIAIHVSLEILIVVLMYSLFLSTFILSAW